MSLNKNTLEQRRQNLIRKSQNNINNVNNVNNGNNINALGKVPTKQQFLQKHLDIKLKKHLNQNRDIMQRAPVLLKPHTSSNPTMSMQSVMLGEINNTYQQPHTIQNPPDDTETDIGTNIGTNIGTDIGTDSIIPLHIYQTWLTKDLPHHMNNAVNSIKNNNPQFEHHLYDDNDCCEFIKNNYDSDVLNAYITLKPGAYKADLWRYCILFIHGGIYLDIKYSPLNGFKFINLVEKEHLVADINGINIYNALMVCLPRNEILFKAIRQIVDNVKNKYYGSSSLDPTGPGLLSKFVSTSDNIVDLKHTELYANNDYKIINYNDIPIIKSYSGHNKDKIKYSKIKHYSILWSEKKIYI